MLSYKQALERIINSVDFIQETQYVDLSLSIDRILAVDIKAPFNSPAFMTSGMDGYALGELDIKTDIKVTDNIPAGTNKEIQIPQNECIKIFTGSKLPSNTQRVIPIENVKYQDGNITITEDVPKNFAIRHIGENFKQNELLIKKGTLIGCTEIGVLASLNIPQIEVYTKSNISILSTGSEILEVGQKSQNDSQIYSSNNYILEALLKKHNANTTRLPIIKDDPQVVYEAVSHALKHSDILVTTGGVSVGDFDFVKDVIQEFGFEVLIDERVNIKPGQHIKVLKRDTQYIFALPGFPYSSLVTAIVFLLPIIKKITNQKTKTLEAKLENEFIRTMNKTHFIAANLSHKNGELFVDFKDKKSGSSAIITNMLNDAVLVEIPENVKYLPKYTLVEVTKCH